MGATKTMASATAAPFGRSIRVQFVIIKRSRRADDKSDAITGRCGAERLKVAPPLPPPPPPNTCPRALPFVRAALSVRRAQLSRRKSITVSRRCNATLPLSLRLLSGPTRAKLNGSDPIRSDASGCTRRSRPQTALCSAPKAPSADELIQTPLSLGISISLTRTNTNTRTLNLNLARTRRRQRRPTRRASLCAHAQLYLCAHISNGAHRCAHKVHFRLQRRRRRRLAQSRQAPRCAQVAARRRTRFGAHRPLCALACTQSERGNASLSAPIALLRPTVGVRIGSLARRCARAPLSAPSLEPLCCARRASAASRAAASGREQLVGRTVLRAQFERPQRE